MKLPGSWRFFTVVATLCILITLTLVWLPRGTDTSVPAKGLSKITIAVPKQLSAGSLVVAQNRSYFRAAGLEANIQSFALGKDALESLLQGKADLAVMADTPFMLAVMNGAQVSAVTTIFSSRNAMALVGRKDHGIEKLADLPGKKIGTVSGTNAQFFAHTLMFSSNLENAGIEIVKVKSGELVHSLENGTVDAITVWNPELAKLEFQQTGNHTVIYAKDLFVYRFVLVGKKNYLESHPEEVKKVLMALKQAIQFIQEQQSQSIAMIGTTISLEPALLSRFFDPKDFLMTLDQSLLLSLSDQSRWAIKTGLVQTATIPNYLQHMHTQALEAIMPSAVKIIR